MKKIIVLDVEGMSGKRPYDIGYLVADFKGTIYTERSFACMPCVWENLSTALHSAEQSVKEMTHRNIQEILSTPQKYMWVDINGVCDALVKDIQKYNITEIWAYNCTFDKGMIARLFNDDRLSKLNVVWLDIWSAIIMTKCLTKKYVRFCRENRFITSNGNCKTSAEVVYAYLTNDIDFQEEHTGLSDCKIEYTLLLTAKRTKKKIDGTVKSPWKLVKRFCEINNI